MGDVWVGDPERRWFEVKIAYVGNFGPVNSTENHYARAFELNGIVVKKIQEAPDLWTSQLPAELRGEKIDLVLWTHTASLTPPEVHNKAFSMLRRLHDVGISTVGVHLDKWWDLKREDLTYGPFFACDVVFTADGGNQQRFIDRGIYHHWLPPGVLGEQCERGTPRREFKSPIAFVGSWQNYHDEWQHRRQLVRHLQNKWGRQCAFWPKAGEHAIRGTDLADLYASVDVLIGDSCLVGGTGKYFSDRIPETIGRGGFLIHPRVEGATDGSMFRVGGHEIPMYEEEEDLLCYEAYDFAELDRKIQRGLDEASLRDYVRSNGRRRVLEWHTYEQRARQILDFVRPYR